MQHFSSTPSSFTPSTEASMERYSDETHMYFGGRFIGDLLEEYLNDSDPEHIDYSDAMWEDWILFLILQCTD